MENELRQYLEHYSERATAALVKAGRPCARIITIAPGEMVAWDEVCDGLLYVRVVTVVPLIPEKRPIGKGCFISAWEVSAAVGVMRCAAGLTDAGFPSAEQIVADGIEMTEDFTATLGAVQWSDFTRSIAGWNPLGPEGNAHGGEWLFTFLMNSQDEEG